MNALLIHGRPSKEEYYDPSFPSPSNSHWFPWLSRQLIIRDIDAVAIEMPKAYYPEYRVWKREFERYDVSDETILVGHSCGAGFLVRWMSENDQVNVKKIILVAPWMGVGTNKPIELDFFRFNIDPQLGERANSVVIINSDDDEEYIQESVKMLRDTIQGVGYKELTGKGHFTLKSLGSEELPELLEEVIL